MAGVLLDYVECVRDTPTFRQRLADDERTCQRVEAKLERLQKAADSLLSQCAAYTSAEHTFTAALQQTAASVLDDGGGGEQGEDTDRDRNHTVATLDTLVSSVSTLSRLHSATVQQIHQLTTQCLLTSARAELMAARERRLVFERASGELDSAISRQVQLVRGRPACEHREALEAVSSTRHVFTHAAVAYQQRLAESLLVQRRTVTAVLRDIFTTRRSYFRDGQQLCEDLVKLLLANVTPLFERLSKQLSAVQQAAAASEMERRQRLTDSASETAELRDEQARVSQLPRHGTHPLTGLPLVDGYLFKRASNAFRKWNRRWFVLTAGQLQYRRRCGDELTVVEPDLRLCTVRVAADTERLYCFEVVSPAKCHTMQADSAAACQQWVDALQAAITDAFHHSSLCSTNSTVEVRASVAHAETDTRECCAWRSSLASSGDGSTSGRSSDVYSPPPLLTSPPSASAGGSAACQWLRQLPGNDRCADCSAPSADWASINLAVTLCIECSGIHRSLGVHVSKIRSLTLDEWEPEVVAVFAKLGNTVVNGVYEANCDRSCVNKPPISGENCTGNGGSSITPLRAQPSSDRSTREAWILAKYVQRRFVAGCVGDGRVMNERGEHQSARCSCVRCQSNLSLHTAAGLADLPGMCAALGAGAVVNSLRGGLSPLHVAVSRGSTAACQYLLLNGADASIVATDGTTALHRSVAGGHMGAVCALLKHRVSQHVLDAGGRDALALAVERADADLVTVLRLASLSEQMRAPDQVMDPADDTFDQVLRDFSRMAADKSASMVTVTDCSLDRVSSPTVLNSTAQTPTTGGDS